MQNKWKNQNIFTKVEIQFALILVLLFSFLHKEEWREEIEEFQITDGIQWS